jgi:hypothetical protein
MDEVVTYSISYETAAERLDDIGGRIDAVEVDPPCWKN